MASAFFLRSKGSQRLFTWRAKVLGFSKTPSIGRNLARPSSSLPSQIRLRVLVLLIEFQTAKSRFSPFPLILFFSTYKRSISAFLWTPSACPQKTCPAFFTIKPWHLFPLLYGIPLPMDIPCWRGCSSCTTHREEFLAMGRQPAPATRFLRGSFPVILSPDKRNRFLLVFLAMTETRGGLEFL